MHSGKVSCVVLYDANNKRGMQYALEKLYFFGIIKNEPKLDGLSFNYGVPMATFQLHHQTLITIVSKYSSRRIKEPKLDGVASFNYGVPMATLAPSSDADYHIVSKYSSRRIKRAQTRWVASFNYGVPMATFQLHHQTLVTI
ncbi:hypothetical protein EVAR_53368_1 [Eumeta japonica]|uniref:Uncharacterized protein n=1 Tax=Eumeta variegata TaxID=151549 RepID=A0A4C1Y595_EUMVA|nr:hypothetical protein EVAR_53368_1 [Eumeta japonica]